MKSLLTIIFSFYCFVTTAGSTLNLNIFPCKTQDSDTAYTIQILRNGEFYKNIILSYSSNFDTSLSNIEKGIYIFKFKNLYKQQVADTLIISKDTLYRKSFCPDEYIFDKTFKGYIDSLKNSEFFLIEFESYGCFHWEKQKLKVFKHDNQFFSTLYPANKVRENRSEKAKIKTAKLSNTQIDLISNFQYDTYKNATGYPGSTEITYYEFKYKNDQLKFVDSQESRVRFKELISALFSKPK
jgi:hypothetical protein